MEDWRNLASNEETELLVEVEEDVGDGACWGLVRRRAVNSDERAESLSVKGAKKELIACKSPP